VRSRKFQSCADHRPDFRTDLSNKSLAAKPAFDLAEQALRLFCLCNVIEAQRMLDFIDHALHRLSSKHGDHITSPDVERIFVDT
jgi:hypothetical protein